MMELLSTCGQLHCRSVRSLGSVVAVRENESCPAASAFASSAASFLRPRCPGACGPPSVHPRCPRPRRCRSPRHRAGAGRSAALSGRRPMAIHTGWSTASSIAGSIVARSATAPMSSRVSTRRRRLAMPGPRMNRGLRAAAMRAGDRRRGSSRCSQGDEHLLRDPGHLSLRTSRASASQMTAPRWCSIACSHEGVGRAAIAGTMVSSHALHLLALYTWLRPFRSSLKRGQAYLRQIP